VFFNTVLIDDGILRTLSRH